MRALNRFCRWLAGAAVSVCTPPVSECARFEAVSQAICDAFQTLTETICDATKTVTDTVCDATQTITQTVCDATTTVTNRVCDAFGSIPLIGGLVCLISHIVSTVVCTASHVVSTVVCTASHIVSTVVCTASHVVSTVVCVASRIVTSTICVFWTIVKAAACVVVGGAAKVTCAVASLFAGPGPILRSSGLPARSVPRDAAFARSLVLATDLRSTADLRSPYDEEGVHVQYRLVDEKVEWAVGPDSSFVPLEFDEADLPSFAQPTRSGRLAASYNRLRRGEWTQPPALDMIAASSDRIIAKRPGTDEIYIAVTAHPYVHRVGDRRLLLPQSFFKLDPELGQAGARVQDLEAHVTIPGDDELHPATERFPFFRRIFRLGRLHIGIPLPTLLRRALGTSQVNINVTLFRGAGATGLWESMDVQFPPRVWHKVDLRPPRNGKEPPARFASFEHVVYATNNPLDPELARHSVKYERVLDLGVGLSHLHEQHDNRFGGELDNLSDDPWFSILGFRAPFSDDAAYRFANGPIRDYGGWVDGTCIYYLLVQLKRSEDIDEDDPASLRDAFAILWADEQLAFTERWRVLHLVDNQFNSPFKPIVAVADRFYRDAPFDPRRYWCPFTEGHVTAHSRMAVTRQIVVVSGIDPSTGDHELYSIHFSWPTMDRTWRWRPLPAGATVRLAADRGASPATATVHPDTLRIREDMTIVLRGSRRIGEAQVPGRWFQRYLPADGQEIPSVADRAQEPAGSKPSTGYPHPWAFVAEPVFAVMDRRFSHLGVYEPIRPRVQCYRVTVADRPEPTDPQIERAVWEDTRHALRIDHSRVDWAAVADFLGGDGQALRRAVIRRTHPSVYNDPMAFKVVRRPGLGWILVHLDKRDDKQLPFDGVGTPALSAVVLSDRDAPASTISLSINAHLRNDVRSLHGRTVGEEVDAVSPPQVRRATVTATRVAVDTVGSVEIAFELARDPSAAHAYATFEEWVAMNVWRVKLGALVPRRGNGLDLAHVDGPGAWDALLLFDAVRADRFTADTPTTYRTVWMPTAADQHDGLLAELLTPEGRVRYGTSLWFVGATGFASCADETVFEPVGPLG